ncbi:SIS domain-containing protein [Candidatus Woesearchaeota archaeon]|nr:SIS domain-containing protein [Candidatus Woesearchaeota archaeon]
MEHITNYIEELKKTIDKLPLLNVKKATGLIFDAYTNDKQIFIIGNGGSASTASHFACDLNKGTLQRVYDDDEKRLRVISMTDNVSLLTAYGNDLSYEDIFSQQLRNFINKGDLLIVITGSGNSKNILKGIETAKKVGATVLGMLGFDGGEAKEMVDYHIIVPSNNYGPIEDIHMVLTHLIASHVGKIKREKEV